jgi:hypothetical protein
LFELGIGEIPSCIVLHIIVRAINAKLKNAKIVNVIKMKLSNDVFIVDIPMN